MRRGAFLLSMLAAIAAAPLRQAEAASDLARSLAEFVQPADVEAGDGGVGDDAGEATFTASPNLGARVPAASVLPLPPPPVSFVLTPAAEAALRERTWPPQAPPGSRQAWLDVFRF